MPLNIVVGLLALLVALVLYSVAAWGAFRAKALSRRHVTLVWAGFAFDVLATAMMAIAAGGLDLEPLSDLLHTVIALAVMAAMLALAIVGGRAVATANEKLLKTLSHCLLYTWIVWVAVFVWGMIARGGARMG